MVYQTLKWVDLSMLNNQMVLHPKKWYSQWESQDPKLEVRYYHISGHIFWGYPLKFGPYIYIYMQSVPPSSIGSWPAWPLVKPPIPGKTEENPEPNSALGIARRIKLPRVATDRNLANWTSKKCVSRFKGINRDFHKRLICIM